MFIFLFLNTETPYSVTVDRDTEETALIELATTLPKIGSYSKDPNDYKDDIEQGNILMFKKTNELGSCVFAMQL